MEKRLYKEASEVSVARINARQAVIIAVITGIIGIVTLIISNHIKVEKDSNSLLENTEAGYYIEIQSVQLSSTSIDYDSRLIFDVSGRRFAYPIKRPWAKVSELRGARIFLDFPPDYRVSIDLQLSVNNKTYTSIPLDNYPHIFSFTKPKFKETENTKLRFEELNQGADIYFAVIKN